MSPLAIFDLIFYLSMAVILIPIFLVLKNFSSQPITYKWLASLLIFSFLCDFMNEVQYNTIHLSNNYLTTFYSLLNPAFLCFFYYSVLRWKQLKIPMILLTVAHISFSIANLIWIQKLTINTYTTSAEKLFIMCFSILYFYKLIRELPSEKIHHSGLFWIISAMFVFNSAKLVVYAFAHYLILFKDNLILAWSLHNIMSIACSAVTGYGVWLHNKNRRLHVAE